jgi:hypothetical protein
VDLADEVEGDFPMERFDVDQAVEVALNGTTVVGDMAGFAVDYATSSRDRGRMRPELIDD